MNRYKLSERVGKYEYELVAEGYFSREAAIIDANAICAWNQTAYNEKSWLIEAYADPRDTFKKGETVKLVSDWVGCYGEVLEKAGKEVRFINYENADECFVEELDRSASYCVPVVLLAIPVEPFDGNDCSCSQSAYSHADWCASAN